MTTPFPITRRGFLAAGAATLAACAIPSLGQSTQPAQRYRISVCDWMLLKRQKLGAVRWASECGCDGVEVDLGSVGQGPDMDNQLRKEEVRKQYLDEAAKFKIEISSLALSGFYAQSVADHPRTVDYVTELLELLPKMGCKVGFLPFAGKTDVSDPAIRARAIERMKAVAPTAEKLGVVLGISINHPAELTVKILDDIGSPAVKSYYSTGEAVEAQRDPAAEIRTLGRDRICQVHLTAPDVAVLEHGPLDVPKVKQALDEIGYHGWLTLERARDPKKVRDVKYNYSTNAAYLKKIFQS
jgi:L-ribulose-5-phosphate 3-epimerase